MEKENKFKSRPLHFLPCSLVTEYEVIWDEEFNSLLRFTVRKESFSIEFLSQKNCNL